jgi:D-alanyl-D-alanine carboxypeptidase/D-alanyl-D-alanine-endopeptidase (penicillin-binding protein 4)
VRDGVEQQLAMAQQVRLARDVAPQERTHARPELVQAEGLGQVVVGARVEPGDAVGNGVARRDDQHAHPVAGPADLLQQVEAALARQPEVEQHQAVGLRARGERRPPGLAVAHPVDRVAVLLQRLLQRLADHGVVFDEEDAHGSPSADSSGGSLKAA